MNTQPDNEGDRLAALEALGIVGTPPEPHFEAVCRTACRLFGVRHAFVAFLGDTHQWLKTPCQALPTTMRRDQSLCQHTIREVFINQKESLLRLKERCLQFSSPTPWQILP